MRLRYSYQHIKVAEKLFDWLVMSIEIKINNTINMQKRCVFKMIFVQFLVPLLMSTLLCSILLIKCGNDQVLKKLGSTSRPSNLQRPTKSTTPFLSIVLWPVLTKFTLSDSNRLIKRNSRLLYIFRGFFSSSVKDRLSI